MPTSLLTLWLLLALSGAMRAQESPTPAQEPAPPPVTAPPETPIGDPAETPATQAPTEPEGQEAAPAVPTAIASAELQRLDELLRDLKTTGPDIWAAKLTRLEAKAVRHRARAAELRAEIARLEAECEREEARAGETEEELAAVRTLRAALGPEEVPAVAARTPSGGAVLPAPQVARLDPKSTAPASAAASEPNQPPSMGAVASETSTPPAAPKPTPNYADHIAPLFEASCTICHDADDMGGGLDLSSYASTLRGGSSGTTLKPGDLDASRLWRLTARLEQPYMPKGRGPIADEELALLKRWIEAGCPTDAAAAKKIDEAEEAARTSELSKSKEPEADAPAKIDDSELMAALDGPRPGELPYEPLAVAARPAPLVALAASPNAAVLATGGIDQVILLDARDRSVLGALPFPGRVTHLEFSRDGEWLLAAGGSAGEPGRATLFQVRDGAAVRSFEQGRDELLAASLSPGKSLVVVGGPTRRVQALATTDGAELYAIGQHGDWILSCDVSADGNYLATADRGGAALVWQADTGRDVSACRGHVGAVTRVEFAPDARRLVTLGEDGTACGWDPNTGNRVWRTNVGSGAALALAWCPDGTVVTGSADGTLSALDGSNGRAKGKLPRLSGWVYSLTVDATGERLFAGTGDGQLAVIDLKSGQLLQQLRPVPSGASAPGGAG